MATGFTDFGDETVGQLPAGWARYDRQFFTDDDEGFVQEVAGSLSGKAISFATGGQRSVGSVFNENVTPFADGEIVFLIRWIKEFDGTGFSTPGHVGVFRGRGDDPAAGNSDGVGIGEWSNAEHLTVTAPGSWEVPASNEQDGTNLRIAAATHGYVDGDRVWIRINFEGEALKIRHWKQGDTEPETWAIEFTETGLDVTAGVPGFSYITGDETSAFVAEALGWSDDPTVSAPTGSTGGGGGGEGGHPRPLTDAFLKALGSVTSLTNQWA